MQIIYVNGSACDDIAQIKHELMVGMAIDADEASEPAVRLYNAAQNDTGWDVLTELTRANPLFASVVEIIDAHPEPQRTALVFSDGVEQAIIRTAGMALTAGMSEHFEFTENGVRVNRANPPSLQQAYEAVDKALQIKSSSEKLDNYSTWLLGNLIDELETLFGEEFNLAQMMRQSQTAYNTAIRALGVYKAFRERRFNLPYTHHNEVFYTNGLDWDQKMAVLEMAERMKLTAKQTRKLASYAKNFGLETLPEDAVEDAEVLSERLSARISSVPYIFRYEDRWWKFRGQLSQVPAGAEPIFAAESLKQVIPAGGNIASSDLPNWRN